MNNHNIKKDNSLAYLNIFKFLVAIIIAVFYHNFFLSQYSSHNIPVISFFHNYAHFFVEFFFIISGMLFYKAYFNKLYKRDITFKSVLRKKMVSIYVIATIFTLYVFIIDYISFAVNDGTMYRDGTTSVLVLFICLICGGGVTLFDGRTLFGGEHLINGPAWYLTALIFCYIIALLITFIIFKLKKKRYTLLFLIPLIIGIFMFESTFVYKTTLPFLWNLDTSRGLIFFFTGIYLMMLLNVIKKVPFKWKTLIRLIALSIAVSYVTILCFRDLRDQLKLLTFFKLGFILYPAIIIGLFDWGKLNKYLSAKPINRITKLSTEIYMLNYPIHSTLYLIGYSLYDFTNMGYWFILFDICLHLLFAVITSILISNKLKNAVNTFIDFLIYKTKSLYFRLRIKKLEKDVSKL